MRKLLVSLVAIGAALFATSCVNELEEGIQGNAGQVTFTVNAPELATRAYGDGTQATHLMYAVYDETAGGDVVVGVSNTEIGTEAEFTADATTGVHKYTTSVQIDLLDGNEYSVLFWAVNADYANAFVIDWAGKAMQMKSTIPGNNDNYDAFYGYVPTFKVEGAVTKSVTLTRPFAQLNYGSTDFADAALLNFVPDESSVVVKNAPTKLNCVDGTVSGQANITYSAAAVPSGKLNGLDANYLAMNYVLVGEKKLYDTTLSVTGNGKTIANDYATVPMQRNYRTNVYGSLLTNKSDFGIELKPGFGGADENMLIVKYQAGSAQDLQNAIDAINNDTDNEGKTNVIELTGDIDLNDLFGFSPVATRAEADPTLVIAKGRELLLDLKGNTLSSKSYQTGKNYNMFDVHGVLTVKNGTITTEHKGTNMAWGNSTNVFNVTDGGVLNLDGVEAKNLGGSDMAFVAHLNNWGEVTLNVENSNLESTYICVRVFNSGNDMNNVTFKNSTFKSPTRVLWVHNYTLADFGKDAAKTAAHQALLNFDIYNGTNTFTVDNVYRMFEYGFTDPINFDAEGNVIASNGAQLSNLIANFNFAEVNVVKDIEIAQIDLSNVTNDVVIDANGHKITTTENYGVKITSGKNVTIKNAEIVMTKEGDYINYAAGVKVDNGDYTGNTVKLENCKVTMANTDWAYGVNMPAFVNNLTLVIDECEIDGALAVQCWGDNNDITITDTELICTYKTNALYTSFCVALQDDGANAAENNTLTIDGCEFSYAGEDNYGSNIYSVADRSGENTVTVTNATYNNDVVPYGYALGDSGIYYIYNADGLKYFANQVNVKKKTYADATVYLAADIDLKNEAWTPIGFNSNAVAGNENYFAGTFDGQNHTIKNLNIDVKDKGGVGLFGTVHNATFKNFTLENAYVKAVESEDDPSNTSGAEGSSNYIVGGHFGAVVGYDAKAGTISFENVHVKGLIQIEGETRAAQGQRIGGIIGGRGSSNISFKNVSVKGDAGSYIKGYCSTAGVSGQIQGVATYENVETDIDVYAVTFGAGGIAGIVKHGSTFTNCSTAGDITLDASKTQLSSYSANYPYRVGGIAGCWSDSATGVLTLTNCSYTGNLTSIDRNGDTPAVLDYAGYVGRGYGLKDCKGSTVNIDGVKYVQKYNEVANAGIYDVITE